MPKPTVLVVDDEQALELAAGDHRAGGHGQRLALAGDEGDPDDLEAEQVAVGEVGADVGEEGGAGDPVEVAHPEQQDRRRQHPDEEELQRRRDAWKAPALKVRKGSLYKYAKTVSSASQGCVTDEL